jgi:hypothetical protein
VARQRKNSPAVQAQKKRRWLWLPKLMLLMACVGLVLFIGAIFIMEEELRRIGLFGPEEGKGAALSQTIPDPTAENGQANAVEEVTQEERRQLEAILQQ